jgi:hypothetical protein
VQSIVRQSRIDMISREGTRTINDMIKIGGQQHKGGTMADGRKLG